MAKVDPINQPLKLRDTASWVGFRSVQTIPICFGKTWVTPVQKNAQRTRWVVSDRPIEGIDKVYIDNEISKNWEFRNAVDETGHPIAEIVLGESLEESSEIKVQLRGAVHPVTGSLITNPADWLWFVLNEFVGIEVSQSELGIFRSLSAKENLELHGVLDDNTTSAFQIITSIIKGMGAVWSPAMPGYATLFPISEKPSTAPYYADINVENSQAHVAVHSSQDVYSIIQILYDYNFAEQEYNGTIELRATDVYNIFGAKKFTVDAKWTATAYEAFSIGKRFIEQKSRPNWQGQALFYPETREIIPPGVWAIVDHPAQIVSGDVFVKDSQINAIDSSTNLSFDSSVGPIPRFEVSQQNVRFDRLGIEIFVEKDEDVYEVLILDANNQPVPNAEVRVGSKVATTNSSGIAKFTGLTPGTYTMTVTANGQSVLTNPNFVVT